MNKASLIALITAAGIEVPAQSTVAQLKELAAANNVSLGTETVEEDSVIEFDPPAEPDPDAELIAEKVRAGLTESQAREVIARQRAEDKANARK